LRVIQDRRAGNHTPASLLFPCPRHCGCAHRVVHHADQTIVGVCQCEPRRCDNIELSAAEITPLQLNRAKLGRAICKVLGLQSKTVDFGLRETWQIGSWSADSVPVVLTSPGGAAYPPCSPLSQRDNITQPRVA